MVRNLLFPRWPAMVVSCALAMALGAVPVSAAPILQAPFDSNYSIVSLGSAPGVVANYGAIAFAPGDPQTLWLGGSSSNSAGVIDALGVTRGADGHISGFTGSTSLVSTAPYIDGGLDFAPNGTAIFTEFPGNQLGEIKPGSSSPDKTIALSSLTPPISPSVGAIVFVPAGFAGAGHLKVVSYRQSEWYDTTLTPDGSGTYDIASVTDIENIGVGSGPEGMIYIHAGNPNFASDSVLVCDYGVHKVAAYNIDANGDPMVATERDFITGLDGVEGAVIDPLTGDFLFSTFGGDNAVLEVGGFVVPEPATLGLLGVGLAIMVRRRRAR